MSIEQKLTELTEAVVALTAAVSAKDASGPEQSKEEVKPTRSRTTRAAASKTTAPKAKADEPKVSRSEMQAALNEVKENLGTKVAKQLISDAGFDKMADVTEDKFEELFAAAKARIDSDENLSSEDEDGL